MFSKISQAFKVKEIRKKILFTLFIVIVFRLGTTIPVPGIDTSVIKNMVENNSLLGLYNMFSGGAFSNFTIFALGISPYITASIIIQLLTAGFESLKELQKSGEEGKKKISKYTRTTALALGIIQAIGITLGIVRSALKVNSPFFIATVIITLVAGSMLVMWLGDRITEKGLGNGSSVIIFVGIISRLPIDIIAIYEKSSLGLLKWPAIVAVAVVMIFTIIGVTFISESTRKIPVQYAKRVVGRKMYGGESSHIPMKVNQSGVMPIIFASSILALPQTVALLGGPKMQQAVNSFFNLSTNQGFWTYRSIEIVLIVVFSYFYNTISFNTEDISKNMKNSGGFIPGVRPGNPTEKYLNGILSKLTIVGAAFLGIMALIPALITHYMKVPVNFGGTSLLIVVGVALELKRQLESNLVMKNYQGFLK
ncbi:MAG: preprotein translocase subunit SecY [Peptostreptococcus porci]|uniref:Protein translocase subunit SecY n=1 Tax=Peptostreptococcus porci TaxID=2652282 RepID=A0A6N7X3L9_9FIRM|nr:preprotein translocase subunit SecY [Peptostreptococcus porci]MDD7183881.1 preprotein translocase subunit SecY [Peptostreptococcus porci]MDY2794690.1 preprotein translocase subunit SecY [Peptostreptococcus porci]MDY5479880.1 preprotein translocase subunit SecY [Peptostreptococcus porci]MDY6232035.1 preprotein translocase subunit SecY [Peptostreptococcus porci]MST62671.1 preprotein translocase subunit SecY [Peptostreptococcus porci]